MGKGFFNVPIAINEPVKSYAPGSPEREAVLKEYKKMYNEKVNVPLYINGKYIVYTRIDPYYKPRGLPSSPENYLI